MNILRPVRNRWREIGAVLLLKKSSLDDFENNPELVKEGPEGFLRETLNTVEHLTVRALASALRSPSLQEEEIALLLEKQRRPLLGRGSAMCISSLLLFPHVFCLKTKVSTEITTLSHSFELLQEAVLKELNLTKSNVSQLHEAVAGVYPDKAIPKSIMTEMQAATGSHNLFAVITRHGMWNYINHHLLEYMVEKTLSQNNHLQNEIEVHKRKVETKELQFMTTLTRAPN